MKNKEIFGWVLSGVSNGTMVVTATSNLNEILYFITLVVGIVSGLLSIVYTIFKWYKRVTKEDSEGGKDITTEEFKELIPLVKEGSEKIKEVIKDADIHK